MTDNDIENDAVRPKGDMNAEKFAENEIKNDAVRPKSDLDAEAFDEDAKKKKQERGTEAAAAKKQILEFDEVNSQLKMWKLEGLLKKEAILPKVRNNA